MIYKVKTAFNKEFEAVHKQKVQEISRVKEKNKRIREIMQELELEEPLWVPTLSVSEDPEQALTVTESEVPGPGRRKTRRLLTLHHRGRSLQTETKQPPLWEATARL